MKERTNILGWLGMAEQHNIMLEAKQHVDETCRTVFYLDAAIKAFADNDLSGKIKAIEAVKQSEREADKLVWKMIKKLSEGLLLPPDREDLLRFANALDKIADSTNRAARILGFIDKKPSKNIVKNILIGTGMISDGVNALRKAIAAARKSDIKEAFTYCEEVERCEHDADDQKRTLIDVILHEKLEASELLLLYNLAEALEAVTDRIETASDQVKILTVQLK